MHVEVQAIDRAFVMANYLRLEPLIRRRMRELRLQGMATRLNYSSKDVDEKREMKASFGFQPRPYGMTGEPIMGNIPPLLASHIRETKRRRRTLSPREVVGVDRNPPNNIYPPNNVNPLNNIYPSRAVYYTGYLERGHMNDEESPSPLTKWIEEFQLLDGLKVPPYVGYYDGKGDLDEFIHAFEGATKMEKWNSQKATTDSWTKYTSSYKQKKRLPKADLLSSWTTTRKRSHKKEDHRKGQEGRTEKDETARDTSKYCEFHLDYGCDTNAYRELENQIEEVVKLGKLAHLIKGIRKGKAKQTNTQPGEWVAQAVKVEPAMQGKEEPILMIRKTCGESPVGWRSSLRHNYKYCFLKLIKEIKERTRDVYTSLSGFSGEQNINHRVRDDTFYNALRSLIPKGCRTKGHHFRISKRKEVQYSNMMGIHQTLKIRSKIFSTEHKLNEEKKITPVQQKKRRMAPDRIAATSEDVEELKKAGTLREIRYQTWVTNTVMVKKTDGPGRYIQQTFERLWKINMKLNPKKCSFGMEEGQFLGYVVSKKELKQSYFKDYCSDIQYAVSIEEDMAYLCLHSPKTTKETTSVTSSCKNNGGNYGKNMNKTRVDYGSGIARPKIKDNDSSELKGQFLKELHDNTFSGSDQEVANEHIEKVLEIVDLFHILNITIDQVMLRAFPISCENNGGNYGKNMTKTRADYGSGIARPKIKDNDSFELKCHFLKELHDNTFSGSDQEVTNEHIEKVLEIVDLFHIPNITIDQVMLRAFPMSLTRATSRWLRNKPSSSITT
nr:reverse transcriptase domain-containing protein [Tanacetum cinerariifolium]